MLSTVFLLLFIILVNVSGLTIDDIEISTIPLTTKENIKTFINSTILATIVTTPSVTIELSTITNILGQDHNSLKSPLSSSLDSSTLSVSASTSFPSSNLLNTRNPSILISDTTEGLKTKNFVVPSNVEYINITGQAGSHVYLPCAVKQSVDKPVSWIRVRDGHILTVDQTIFIADERFQPIYTQNPERWSLQIKYVQSRDAGSYECQISTEPKMSARVYLNVIKPKTEILGEKNRHVKAGSRVILRCIVSEALEPPLFINWFFDSKQIYLHNRNSWQTKLDREISLSSYNENSNSNHNSTISKQNTIASLIIPSVTKKDSGNYTCSPSNSESITVILHVLNGEYSASAITSGCDLFYVQFYFSNIYLIFCYFCIFLLN